MAHLCRSPTGCCWALVGSRCSGPEQRASDPYVKDLKGVSMDVVACSLRKPKKGPRGAWSVWYEALLD